MLIDTNIALYLLTGDTTLRDLLHERSVSVSFITDVNQGLKSWAFSVPKNPEFEHVIPNAFVDLFENWRCQHQKDSASGNLGFPCAE